MVQLVKCLVYKREALKLIPKTYLKVSDSVHLSSTQLWRN